MLRRPACGGDGFAYAWFCERYEIWNGRLSPTMRQSHAAGERVFVDYAGDTIDLTTGAVRAMKLFVAAMGASSFVYAEARPSEGLAYWIGCHVGLFAFLGSVPGVHRLRQPQRRGDQARPLWARNSVLRATEPFPPSGQSAWLRVPPGGMV